MMRRCNAPFGNELVILTSCSPYLLRMTATTARPVVNRDEWQKTLGDWQKSAAKALKGHPWKKQPSATLTDDLRGGPADSTPAAD